MNILGCIKIVPDLDLIAEEDWVADDRLLVDTGYVKRIWNCFDESALEMMLKLSDLSEGFDVVYKLQALTVGEMTHDPFLKILYALGYEHTARINVDKSISFCPEWIAKLIAGYIEKVEKPDVVVMGVQSSDGNNKKTPIMLAELLGWPCFTQVTDMAPADETHLIIKCQTEEGMETRLVHTPCVLAVGNAPCSYLRVPTLKDKMKSGKKQIAHYEADAFCSQDLEELTELQSLHPIDRSRKALVIAGSTPQEKAETLYYSYLKGRLEQL